MKSIAIIAAIVFTSYISGAQVVTRKCTCADKHKTARTGGKLIQGHAGKSKRSIEIKKEVDKGELEYKSSKEVKTK
jgi:hypothetical protein